MIELDRGHFRLVAWIATTFLLMFTIYSNQVTTLTSGLGDLLSSTLGTLLPAIPFLALLLVLTALRWDDFHAVLLTERGLTSRLGIRLAGVLLILLPVTLWALFFGSGGPSTYLAMELSASSLVLVAYGTLLVINPTMWRIMLPYASLYAVGLLAPLVMLDLFGDPLAVFCSYIAAQIANALGIHVVWQGASFGFVSLTGESIDAVVEPACSAAYSISIYLGLLGLMYLDMRRSPTATAKYAVAGVILLPLLNSARIALTILFGYLYGSTAFWWIHDWLGYAIFLIFYIAVLMAYSRTGKPVIARNTVSPSEQSSPSSLNQPRNP
ncbi:MAG: exosortase/archaeosortase family protein [Nitrososphaerales archaeon]